jgi:hypothetical protein
MTPIQPTDLIMVSEARELLGVSWNKMAKLIKLGVVRHFPNPLDNRVKFVSKAEVLALVPRRAEAA